MDAFGRTAVHQGGGHPAGPPARVPSPSHRARPARAAALLTALLTLLGLVALAGPAASSAHAAGSSCTGRLVKRVAFTGGELRVYRSRSYACATTVAARPGARRDMAVSLQARGGRAAVDRGRFTRQAGPVTVHALNRCVRATGSIAGRTGSTDWFGC